jgi:hypothetical protein
MVNMWATMISTNFAEKIKLVTLVLKPLDHGVLPSLIMEITTSSLITMESKPKTSL